MADPARIFRLGRFGALALGMLVAACAPNLGPLPKLMPATHFAAARSFAVPRTTWPSDNWWLRFHDPELTALITEGLKGAPDLEIAAARLRLAAAAAEEAGANELPSLNGCVGDGNKAQCQQRLSQVHQALPTPQLA
jgi:outer membrane protein TolC